jgi:hypothetical protein
VQALSPVELGVLTVGTDSILHGLTIDRVTPGVNTKGRQDNQELGEGRQVINPQACQVREANLARGWQPTNRQG